MGSAMPAECGENFPPEGDSGARWLTSGTTAPAGHRIDQPSREPLAPRERVVFDRAPEGDGKGSLVVRMGSENAKWRHPSFSLLRYELWYEFCKLLFLLYKLAEREAIARLVIVPPVEISVPGSRLRRLPRTRPPRATRRCLPSASPRSAPASPSIGRVSSRRAGGASGFRLELASASADESVPSVRHRFRGPQKGVEAGARS